MSITLTAQEQQQLSSIDFRIVVREQESFKGRVITEYVTLDDDSQLQAHIDNGTFAYIAGPWDDFSELTKKGLQFLGEQLGLRGSVESREIKGVERYLSISNYTPPKTKISLFADISALQARS